MPNETEDNPNVGWSASKVRAALPDGAVVKTAKRLRLSPSTVSQVVGRYSRSRRIEIELAKFASKTLGREVTREEMFGPPGRRGVPRARVAA